MALENQSDEQQIRSVIDTWIAASRAGDLDALMNLMTDDIAFLTPGHPPMRRDDFSSRSRAMAGKVTIEGHPDMQEITVLGDHAICWNYFEVEITRLPEGERSKQAGHILSVFRKGNDGQWRLWRDANLLAPVKQST